MQDHQLKINPLSSLSEQEMARKRVINYITSILVDANKEDTTKETTCGICIEDFDFSNDSDDKKIVKTP